MKLQIFIRNGHFPRGGIFGYHSSDPSAIQTVLGLSYTESEQQTRRQHFLVDLLHYEDKKYWGRI